MLIITVEKDYVVYERRFPEDPKGEKAALKFLCMVHDSQLAGPHKKELEKLIKEKKKEYSYWTGKSKQGGCMHISAEFIPKERLKVSIIHDYLDLL